MADDIVVRLREMLDGPVPYTAEPQDLRYAIAEIERLRSLSDQLGNALLTMKNLYQHSSRFFDSALQAWIEQRRP